MKITRRIFNKKLLVAAALLAVGFTSRAQAAIDVVATIPELGAIAKDVGGDNVSVYTIAKVNDPRRKRRGINICFKSKQRTSSPSFRP